QEHPDRPDDAGTSRARAARHADVRRRLRAWRRPALRARGRRVPARYPVRHQLPVRAGVRPAAQHLRPPRADDGPDERARDREMPSRAARAAVYGVLYGLGELAPRSGTADEVGGASLLARSPAGPDMGAVDRVEAARVERFPGQA